MDAISTGICSNATVGQCCTQLNCSDSLVAEFHKRMSGQILRLNVLQLVNAIFAGVIVGIGAYGHRYRYRGFTRYLFLAATTLFLPIISYILSDDGTTSIAFFVSFSSQKNLDEFIFTARCYTQTIHPDLAILCICLVPVAVISASAVVAGDDKESRTISPPFELIVHGIWIFYLVISTSNVIFFRFVSPQDYSILWGETFLQNLRSFMPFALIYAKMALKYYAFQKARRSFALGRNPRLIVGYMQQLRERSQYDGSLAGEVDLLPPLVVMGEEGQQVDKQCNGYLFKEALASQERLVTIDRVWQCDHMLLLSMPQLKYICLAFALFKLLRCRFARYKLIDAISMETLTFFRSMLLKDGQHERVFVVIADEISFLHDYYYTSVSVSYVNSWLPMLNICVSLLSICFCIWNGTFFVVLTTKYKDYKDQQIYCSYWCTYSNMTSQTKKTVFGNMSFDIVPALSLLVLIIIVEAREIASYVCSNWSKVVLICRCVNRASMQSSPIIQKWVGFLLRRRCKLMKHWNEEMSQCSVLVLQPRKGPLGILRRLPYLPETRNNVEVPTAVKVCIINALRSSSNGGLRKGTTSMCRSQLGESFLWACSSKGTSDTILIWHIATSILEVRHPLQLQHHLQQGSPIVDHKITATHLSCYCAYLVAFCPELLPDDDAWSKSLYMAVKKDAQHALPDGVAVSRPEEEYRQLVGLLSARSRHDVLKSGARLGKQLVELVEGEAAAWEVLANFWSEMILYVAPSDNLDAHATTIARGGELITLLWVLLAHMGIVSRPDESSDTASTSASAG